MPVDDRAQEQVSMRELLASCAAADAVSKPPSGAQDAQDARDTHEDDEPAAPAAPERDAA